MVAHRRSCHAGRPEEPGHRDRGGALDVVVEAADPVPVALEQGDRGLVGEVLELDARAGEDLLHSLDELIDEVEVLLARHAQVSRTGIERIREKGLVVGAHVEHHRQACLGRHAGARGVQGKLADGDPHAAHAQVAQPEDAFAIGDDDEPHVPFGPVAQDLGHAPLAAHADVQALGPAHDVAEALAGLAHGRRVDQRHVGRQVAAQQRVEEMLVAILQFREVDVPLQRGGLRIEVRPHAKQLRVESFHAVGQEPRDAKALALGLGEGRALVESRGVEDPPGVGRGHWPGTVVPTATIRRHDADHRCTDAFALRRQPHRG